MADDHRSTKGKIKWHAFPDGSCQVPRSHCFMDICYWDTDEWDPVSRQRNTILPDRLSDHWGSDQDRAKGKVDVLCFLSLTGCCTRLSAESAFSHFKTSRAWFKLTAWTDYVFTRRFQMNGSVDEFKTFGSCISPPPDPIVDNMAKAGCWSCSVTLIILRLLLIIYEHLSKMWIF